VGDALRRLFGRPPRANVYVYAGTATLTLSGEGAFGVVSTSATTIDDKVEYLLRRDQDAQRQMSELAGRISNLEAETPRQLEDAQRRLERHVADALAAAQAEYRPLRIAGTVLLVVGLVCVTVATFIG
jgi:hypothetical protein